MERNEANWDRIARGVVSGTALGTGIAVGGPLNPIGAGLMVVGTIAGLTAATGYCPVYSVLGVSTRSSEEASA